MGAQAHDGWLFMAPSRARPWRRAGWSVTELAPAPVRGDEPSWVGTNEGVRTLPSIPTPPVDLIDMRYCATERTP